MLAAWLVLLPTEVAGTDNINPVSQNCLVVICVVSGSVATVCVFIVLLRPNVGPDVSPASISLLPRSCFEINSEFRVSVEFRGLEFPRLLHEASTEIGAGVES